jgi:tight adherence protein C
MMMLIVLFALSLGLAIFLAAEAATYPARERRASVARVARYGGASAPAQSAPQEVRTIALGRALLLPFARLAAPLVPPKARKELPKRLLSAGLADRLTPEHVLGLKGLGIVAGILIGAWAAAVTKPAMAIMVGLLFGLICFVLPDILLNGRIRSRRDEVRAMLPDALDLLAVSVEAGLGFDGAVAKLTETMEGPLIQEFALALKEMRIGESRAEALKRMAARMDVPELTAFVRAVVQADQLGSSLSGILRIQAADVRARRQLAAEEKAMQLPVKMLFPLMLFILPALFIMVLGPALLNFGKGLG